MRLDPRIRDLIEKRIGKRIHQFPVFVHTEFSILWSVGDEAFLLKRPLYYECVAEGKIMAAVRQQFPEIVPSVFCLEKGYFILEKLQNSPFALTALKTAFRNYGMFQKCLKQKNFQLPRFPVEMFPNFLKKLFRLHGDFAIKNRLDILSRTKRLCNEVAGYDIPVSVEHGDLHCGNILSDSRGILKFIDWSEASITHPFLSMAHFLFSIHTTPISHKDQILDSYLSCWGRGRRELRAIFAKVQTLSLLFYAFRYFENTRFLLGRTRDKMRHDSAYFLRLYLEKIQSI